MNKLSNNALQVINNLYAQKGETPKDIFKRVADAIGNNETERYAFFTMMNDNIFRPNTPCLIAAGRKTNNNPINNQYSACFILGLDDTMESIIELWDICSKIYASGAGAGIPIGNLREKGASISTGGMSSGPLEYMKVIDTISNTVKSGGKSRRAANIAAMPFNHPDILEFVNSKKDGDFQNFNLSVSVTNDFMQKVDRIYSHNDPDAWEVISLVSPKNDKIVGTLSIKKLWDNIVENAYNTGCPGLLFIDRINEDNAFPSLGTIEVCNPCGEIPQNPDVSCTLGSINVAKMCVNGKVDYFALQCYTETAVTFLNNIIDKTSYLHERFHIAAEIYRPIGLGIMGFADLLIKLNIRYGSDESIQLFEKITMHITKTAIMHSIKMAEKNKKSIVIPKKDRKHFITYMNRVADNCLPDNWERLFNKFGIYNSTWTCIAPTGSVALSNDCSYGWEPHMALIWKKEMVDEKGTMDIIQPDFKKCIPDIEKKTGKTKEYIINTICENNGSIQNIPWMPKEYKHIFVVAHDIDPKDKIKMQGMGQKHISMGISSTCNLPSNATKKNVSNIMLEAYRKGLKGITIYRDGSHKNQVVKFGKEKEITIKKEERQFPIKRPIKRNGSTIEVNTPHGRLYTTCNYDQYGTPIEIFMKIGKQGALTNTLLDAFARVCSKALQYGLPLNVIADTLAGIMGDAFWFKTDENQERTHQADSIMDCVATIIKFDFIKKNKELDKIKEASKETKLLLCPNCGKIGIRKDMGCSSGLCIICGYSACS